MKKIKCPNCRMVVAILEKRYSETEMIQIKRLEAILFCSKILYEQANPNTKMDIPSFVYEQVEKQYDKWVATNK